MILMNDFKADPFEMTDAVMKSVERVITSGRYVLGPELEKFESSWAEFCQSKTAVGVANGMDAIELMLRSANVGEGDEVITTPMTAFASVLAIIRSGATPVLADIDSNTALLSIDSVTRCLSKKTKAILLVHLYGHIAKMDEWVSFCKANNLILFEDCAQAHMASLGGKVAGSFGLAGAYSFYPTKNLGAVGDAGAVVTSNEEMAERVRVLRNYGQSVRYCHPDAGMNSRLDEIQAAILSEKLKWLKVFTNQRRFIATQYNKRINNNFVDLMSAPEHEDAHVHHLYVIKSVCRDKLQNYLLNCGIQTLIHYPIPIHHQTPCLSLGRDPQGLIKSENHSKVCLSLPCHPHMTQNQIDKVIDTVNAFNGS